MSDLPPSSRLSLPLETGIHLLLRIFTGKQVLGEPPRAPQDGPPRPVIYYANHASHLDAPLIWYALPRVLRRLTHPVAGMDYWEKSRARRFLANRVFNVLMLERAREGSCHTNRLASLIQSLQHGESLILFPEGTRSTEDHVADFKPGLYHLHQQVPEAILIPVYLAHLRRVLPKGASIPLPCQCQVCFGQPLADPEEKEDKSRFLTRAREALISLAP